MKTKTAQKQSTARGYCLIPGNRLDILNKVLKRLQKDGISYLMEDVDAGVIRALHGYEGVHTESGMLLPQVCINVTPATRITWPAAQ